MAALKATYHAPEKWSERSRRGTDIDLGAFMLNSTHVYAHACLRMTSQGQNIFLEKQSLFLLGIVGIGENVLNNYRK